MTVVASQFPGYPIWDNLVQITDINTGSATAGLFSQLGISLEAAVGTSLSVQVVVVVANPIRRASPDPEPDRLAWRDGSSPDRSGKRRDPILQPVVEGLAEEDVRLLPAAAADAREEHRRTGRERDEEDDGFSGEGEDVPDGFHAWGSRRESGVGQGKTD